MPELCAFSSSSKKYEKKKGLWHRIDVYAHQSQAHKNFIPGHYIDWDDDNKIISAVSNQCQMQTFRDENVQ